MQQEARTKNHNDRPVTVYDIADRLNLSASTVSRVLNNSSLVGEETRVRILQTAQEMGYRRRRIRRHEARKILNVALFLPYGNDNYFHLFYDAAEFIHAIDSGFGDVRVRIITVVNSPGVQLFASKKTGDVDACIFGFTTPDADLLSVIDEREIPTILINRIDDRHNYVVSDHGAGMKLLFNELLDSDPRLRPFYLGFPVIPQVSDLRRAGLYAAAAERGITLSDDDSFDLASIEDITPKLLENLLKRGYNALVCFNDVVAVYAYQRALRMGLRIPEDFSLTGFDNSPVRSLVCDPITTIDLTVPDLGYKAGAWLRSVIIDKSDETMQLHVPGSLIRGSTVKKNQGGEK